jgi:rhamnose utilization protein RhaD (predicted bifunctional aldolase and dehydrogenase)
MTIATNITKALMDLTGEPRIELAIMDLLKDAIEHRIEKIEKEINNYEQKYNMRFEEFKEKFEKNEIADSYSYDVEIDYLEWEGLISRLNKYTKMLNDLK